MEQLIDVKNQVELDIKIREANTKIYNLDRIAEEIKRGYLCVFAGAGLSAASGYVDWKTLLEPMGKQLGLNINMDLTVMAQYYKNKFTRDELNRRVLEEFAKIPKSNANMEILASMPIKKYWTTNYDSIIEDTLKSKGKIVDIIIEQLQFKYHTPYRDAEVIKMHGDKTMPDTAVLCKDDYESYDEKRGLFTQSLTLDLISNTFLFIGFSFSDPNLDRIIAIVKRIFDENAPKKHYCFLRRVHLEDYLKGDITDEKAKEQYEVDFNNQECKIQDMIHYGIETILVDDFEQITYMLKYIRDKIKLNSVFISGALNSKKPNDYGSFKYKEKNGHFEKGEDFIMKLSNALITNGYKIVTGFGVGVGNYIVAGAYSLKKGKKNHSIEDSIQIQPMICVDAESEEIVEGVRKELIEKCGTIITIFGKNRIKDIKDDLSVLDKDGTYVEYRIAKDKKKIIIIPIGATGFTSEHIYNEEKENWIDNIGLYEALGDKKASVDDLIKNIIEGIEYKKNKREEEMCQVLINSVFNPISESKLMSEVHIKQNIKDIQNYNKNDA